MRRTYLCTVLLLIPLLVPTGASVQQAAGGPDATTPAVPDVAPPAHVQVQDADPAGAAARVHDYLSRLEAFGLAGGMVLTKDGRVLLAQGYGLAERMGAGLSGGADSVGSPAPASRRWTGGTVSTVGSITKQFTAAAIMELAERGHLSVQDSIDRFFGAVPPDKRGITLHHLLTHTSGLGELGAGDFDFISREEVVERAMASKLLGAPGSDYRYSNLGYSLLGAVVEIVTGRGYETWLREQLFVPAGMYETGYVLPFYEPDRVAVGYRRGDRWGTVIERLDPSTGPSWILRANGGVHTTLHDMLRWIEALGVMQEGRGGADRGERGGEEMGEPDRVGVRRPLLDPASRAQVFAAHADEGGGSSYGYGWSVDTTARGTPTYRHDGGNGIHHSELHLFPREGVVTFMMTSDPGLRATRLLDRVNRVYFGGDVVMPPRVDAAAVEPGVVGKLAGRYGLDSGGRLEVESAGTALVLHVEGQRAIDRLFAGDRPGRVPYDSLNRRARSFVEAFAEGDFVAMRALMGQDAPREPYRAFRDRLLRQAGTLESFEVLGTVPAWFHEGSSEATWVRLHLQRMTTVRRIHWDADGALVGLGGQVYPAPISLRCAMTGPTSCTGWHAGLALEAPSVEFVSADTSGAAAIVIQAAGGEVEGRRVAEEERQE